MSRFVAMFGFQKVHQVHRCAVRIKLIDNKIEHPLFPDATPRGLYEKVRWEPLTN